MTRAERFADLWGLEKLDAYEAVGDGDWWNVDPLECFSVTFCKWGVWGLDSWMAGEHVSGETLRRIIEVADQVCREIPGEAQS